MADNSGIKLFEHNEIAYISAVRMLKETGKAAVIHPTGTGKSFIAFKLCEDNADKKICWLSPGEYIFKTQCENLTATGSAVPNNIAFFTYAKLMLMTDAELEEIKPDYIILDEFHRCGAEMWGQGVKCLLNMYSDTPVLGLTATNIRYLDNRRDMADGLDKVFAKHMPKSDGKYIVFCASFDHMNEMADKAKEWFAKVDAEPHIYKAYSNDPATSKAFSAFMADVSKHLKLLYSIDMLNEGIHVDGIDGVILLRPTVSPIIYKKEYRNLNIPAAYATADGCKIGRWIHHQREKYDTLSLARRKKLDDIGLFKMKSTASRQNYADENLLFGEQI